MTPCYVCRELFPDSALEEHYLEHIPKVDEPTQQQVSYVYLIAESFQRKQPTTQDADILIYRNLFNY